LIDKVNKIDTSFSTSFFYQIARNDARRAAVAHFMPLFRKFVDFKFVFCRIKYYLCPAATKKKNGEVGEWLKPTVC
jgi:hypothetical protein